MMRTLRRTALACLWLLAGCLSAGPAAPPVRHFDPSPPAPPAGAASVEAVFRCRADASIGREFLLRVGPRELVFDAEHRWIAEPSQILESALAARATGRGPVVDVQLQAFELDLVDGPRAVVRARLLHPDRGGHPVTAVAPAGDRGPAALAAAMAAALQQATDEIVARVR